MTKADIMFMRYIARKAVEDEIMRKGDKLRNYSAKALIQGADDYIREHWGEVMHEVVMHKWERRFEPMREKGSGKTALRKPQGMGFFRTLFVGE
jgi:hypothetical protein